MTIKINFFFEGCSWLKFNNLELELGIVLKFCTSVAKGLKLNIKTFWWIITIFVEVTGEKLVEEGPFWSLILNRVKGTVFWHIPREIRTFSACLVNTRENTFLPDKQLLKMPLDKYFHISNFWVCRCSTKYVFLKIMQNSLKTPVPESPFNKVTCLSNATLLKETILIQVFPNDFYRTPPGDCFCSMENYFTNKIVKNTVREKNWNS